GRASPVSRPHLAALAIPVAAAFVCRLVGDAGVVAAIGQPDDGLAAAEEEVRLAGIADRPVALLFAQLQERAALPDGDDVFERLRFGLDLRLVGGDRVGRERGVTAYRIANAAEHVRRRSRLAGSRTGRGGGLGASGETEAMHLADDGVARNSAQLTRDL